MKKIESGQNLKNLKNISSTIGFTVYEILEMFCRNFVVLVPVIPKCERFETIPAKFLRASKLKS